MAKLLDGRRAADLMLRRLARQIALQQRTITLATILVGDRFDSALYVKLKTRAAGRVGIRTEPHRLQAGASQAQLHRLIRTLNAKKSIHGILLQLPLPARLNADFAVSRIDPEKDVDGFHPATRSVIPPPVAAVLQLLKMAKPRRRGQAIILAKPSVFSQRLSEELERRGFEVLIEHPTRRIPPFTKQADLVVTALGRGPMLRGSHLKRGTILIDVGTRRRGNKVTGDADPSVLGVAGAISPVPGGVGPLTIAYLLYNTFILSKRS